MFCELSTVAVLLAVELVLKKIIPLGWNPTPVYACVPSVVLVTISPT